MQSCAELRTGEVFAFHFVPTVALLVIALCRAPSLHAQAQQPSAAPSSGDFAKAVQNPVASLISVPIQNLTDFNIGPHARERNTVLQFQPVIPLRISENWNLVTRVIGALVYQPDVTSTDPPVAQRTGRECNVMSLKFELNRDRSVADRSSDSCKR